MRVIKNKLVLITGGASGIGKLMAFDFAGRGGRVFVWDINQGQLEQLEKEAKGRGLSITGMICDVSDKEEVYKNAGILTEKYGPVDVLINNAGVVSGRTLLETPDEKIIRTLNINTLSLFWTVKAFLPGMIERDSGHIVTVSSAAGIIGVKGLADYCASKFAAVGFDESLRMELKDRKSRVGTTLVCPYFIDTGMFEGVKTRLPLLLPILKSGYAARRIVRAVLKNKKRLIMPRFVAAVNLMRIFPPGILDFCADLCGISRSMDEFKGREA
ncbi:MAG: SDR family oxidoreductase [Treponema sp.]|jgi:all-trans-retinol dehydrogenase (NAD+)|nr:SDR family oxidoreductase [Treponema sp.]